MPLARLQRRVAARTRAAESTSEPLLEASSAGVVHRVAAKPRDVTLSSPGSRICEGRLSAMPSVIAQPVSNSFGLRKLIKTIRKALRRRTYWRRRRDYLYYREVIRLAKQNVPLGGRVIDVGAHETRILSELSWFERRVALDVKSIPPQRGIERIHANFLTHEVDAPYDLVLCLQVLEHLRDPEPFARRLFSTGSTVIISVPFKWPEGKCRWHVQDPIDRAKLRSWTGRKPTESIVVRDPNARLIAVYSPEPSALTESHRADDRGDGPLTGRKKRPATRRSGG